MRLRPSWLPSVLATRLATGMKVGVRRDLQLGQVALGHCLVYSFSAPPFVACWIFVRAAASSSSRRRFAAATPSWIALPTG